MCRRASKWKCILCAPHWYSSTGHYLPLCTATGLPATISYLPLPLSTAPPAPTSTTTIQQPPPRLAIHHKHPNHHQLPSPQSPSATSVNNLRLQVIDFKLSDQMKRSHSLKEMVVLSSNWLFVVKSVLYKTPYKFLTDGSPKWVSMCGQMAS